MAYLLLQKAWLAGTQGMPAAVWEGITGCIRRKIGENLCALLEMKAGKRQELQQVTACYRARMGWQEGM